MRFVYSVVRFVPDPVRGEFVNVGAIVGCEETSEWQVRQVDNSARARKLDDCGALGAVWEFLDHIGREVDDHQRSLDSLLPSELELSELWLSRLCHNHQNIVQLSPPGRISATSADEAMSLVFEEFVVSRPKNQRPFRDKSQAFAAVSAAYKSFRVEEQVKRRVALRTASHSVRIDFAVANGRALQLTQAWSFQIPDQDELSKQVLAWGWTIQDVMERGGTVIAQDDREFAVNQDVDVEVLYIPPADGQKNISALHAAESVFSKLNVKSHPVGEAHLIGRRAHELLGLTQID